MPSPESLFDARLQADPGGPLVTFYDDQTGERAELSAKSLANWVAKTHFLLQDSLGLGPGDRALVALPVHWLAAPILLGCWYAGLEVVTAGSPDAASAAVVFTDAGALAALPDLPAAADVLAVSLLSMARPDVPPAGAEDYALAVRPMPDSWAGVRAQAGPDDAALDGASRAELAALAGTRAAELGLAAGGRLLWSGERPLDWVSALLAPLVVAGSVVLVRNGDSAKLTGRAEAERASSLA